MVSFINYTIDQLNNILKISDCEKTLKKLKFSNSNSDLRYLSYCKSNFLYLEYIYSCSEFKNNNDKKYNINNLSI